MAAPTQADVTAMYQTLSSHHGPAAPSPTPAGAVLDAGRRKVARAASQRQIT